ncbi:MAG: hypothetical protein RM368_33070 [Nostoc sp. DedSLP03]|uniref:hypothetical protein n=1 Tax=Nostoc sp. DedSLP03 TaxID=3075400 RepID=UPI002AD42CFC|nr:hypothetical protein [Nostoc sp. DedSLP03]MDZ7969723.1 hypothetical protein [Nostoc sp. DedSLP03]
MVAAVALQSQNQPQKSQFFMATPEELKQGYKAKIFNAEAYLYCLFKAKRAAGWRWRVNVKNFCAEWEIAESTFYRALSKLRAKNLVFWQSGDNTIVLWWEKKDTKIANVHSSDLPSSPNPDTAMALQDVREPLQDVREPLQDIREPLQDVREENPQTLAVGQSCNASYSLHIDPEINTDFKEEVCVFSGEVEDQDPECGQQSNLDHETNQDPIPESHTTLLNNTETMQVVDTTSHKGRDFAPPIRKTSQKQEWACPGTDEEKNEFLMFKGGLLVVAKQCQSVEARTAALSWANHKPEAANLLWEDWQRQKEEDANRNTAIATVPEFRRMDKQEHVAVLNKFINHTKQEFLKLCWWHEYWLKFAVTRLGQQLIPGLTPEVIKQIKQALR